MKVITKKIQYQARSDRIKLTPLGDFHLGHALCDEQRLEEVVADIESDPYHYTGLMGDIIDGINRTDKRHREDALAPWLWGQHDIIKPQRERALEVLSPIKDKILWSVEGNHERWVHHRYDRDVYLTLCEALGHCEENRIVLGVHGLVRLVFQRMAGGEVADSWTVMVYVHHGYGGGELSGGKALKLGRLPGRYMAHLFLLGHVHSTLNDRLGIVEALPGADRARIISGFASYTGTFLNFLDPDGVVECYAEEKGYPPLPVGYIEIEFYPDKRRIKLSQES